MPERQYPCGFQPDLPRQFTHTTSRRPNILIFPEGERSKVGKLLPFQLGLGVMVTELGIPIVPIKISGTEQVLPHDASWPKPGKVTVTFGGLLRFRYEDPGEIVERTRRAVEDL